MFGYVNINRNELSDENKKIYQGYYCGLCQKLKEVSGRKGQMLLNYDMTFLAVRFFVGCSAHTKSVLLSSSS